MISYLFINLLISFWALAINRWMLIPERIKFPVLMLAMMSWLLPYHLISLHVELNTVNETIYTVHSLATYIETPESVRFWVPSMIQLGLLFMLCGVLMFVLDVMKLIHKHRWLVNKGQSTKYKNVRLVDDLVGACVTGFWQPKIWINTKLFRQAERDIVLAHERQHLRNGDIYWLLIIGFVYRLFWFNPMVYWLNKRLREVIELRCDEACQKQSTNKRYQHHLAKIILEYQQTKPTALINEISQNNSFQIKRIQKLSQEKNMTKKHKFYITVSLIIIALLSTASLANQDKLEKVQLADNEVVVDIIFEVTEQFSGLSEASSTNKQMVVEVDDWQEVKLDRYTIKFKISEPATEANQFMIDTQILNRQNTTLYRPSILTEPNQKAGIKVSAETINEPAFGLNFTVLSK
ncbi:M56 family metallopeptidase [Marinicella gelatinilytica]|uniref:M56 family metallopeptidase n=1 Tax=Marinicella gelatinilytica TaxID=2996017 RepID=UPI0022609569|nr:M56 family metallopeptidase [Marinicella gelatinilytica]MCX7545221.1 M56 family metallopeptidase [Marinicella gelatinilytica]